MKSTDLNQISRVDDGKTIHRGAPEKLFTPGIEGKGAGEILGKEETSAGAYLTLHTENQELKRLIILHQSLRIGMLTTISHGKAADSPKRIPGPGTERVEMGWYLSDFRSGQNIYPVTQSSKMDRNSTILPPYGNAQLKEGWT